MKENELLRAIYVASLRRGRATRADLQRELNRSAVEVRQAIDEAGAKGTIIQTRNPGGVRLTAKGRGKITVVMLGGAFEIIHPGHLHTMEEAKELGDTLVVVVASDEAVLRNKGREPVTSQDWRVRLVSAVRPVDVAVAGGKGSIYDTLEKVRPDVVALGYDQRHDPVEIEAEARKRGIKVKVVRLDSPIPGIKTSKIVSVL